MHQSQDIQKLGFPSISPVASMVCKAIDLNSLCSSMRVYIYAGGLRLDTANPYLCS